MSSLRAETKTQSLSLGLTPCHRPPRKELRGISHHSHIKQHSPSQIPLLSPRSTSPKLNKIRELTFIGLCCCTSGHLTQCLQAYSHQTHRWQWGGAKTWKDRPNFQGNLPSVRCQYVPPSTSNYQHGDSDCPRGPCLRTETQTNNRR